MPGLRRATAWRFGYLLIQGGSGALVFVVLAHILTPRELGAAGLALAVAVTVQVLADFGLSQVTTSAVPRAGDAEREVAAALAGLFARAALLAVLGIVVAALFVGDGRDAVLAMAPAGGAALLVSGAESLARALGDPRRPVLLAVANRLTIFPLLGIFGDGLNAWQATALYSAAACGGGALAAHDLLRLRRGARPAAAPGLLRTAGTLGTAGVLVALATRANVVVLSWRGGLVDVGRYEAAWRAYQPLIYVAGALGSAAAPFAARALAANRPLLPVVRRGLLLVTVTGVVGAVVLLLAAGPITEVVYGRADGGATAAIRWLAAGLPLALVALYVQTAVLVPAGEGRTLIRAAAAMCVIALLGTTLVAPRHGAAGTAATFVAAELAGLLLLLPAVGRSLASGRNG